MKQSYCPYGLYFGEKIEIYYNKLDDRNEPILINSIEYTTSNKEGSSSSTLTASVKATAPMVAAPSIAKAGDVTRTRTMSSGGAAASPVPQP